MEAFSSKTEVAVNFFTVKFRWIYSKSFWWDWGIADIHRHKTRHNYNL